MHIRFSWKIIEIISGNCWHLWVKHSGISELPVHNMQFSIRLGMAEESAHNKDKKQFIKKWNDRSPSISPFFPIQ